MSHICSQNADVAYLFRPLGLFFTDKVSQYRQRTRLLEHWPVCLFISIVSEGQADGDRLSECWGNIEIEAKNPVSIQWPSVVEKTRRG
jgi:hypothetical protein